MVGFICNKLTHQRIFGNILYIDIDGGNDVVSVTGFNFVFIVQRAPDSFTDQSYKPLSLFTFKYVAVCALKTNIIIFSILIPANGAESKPPERKFPLVFGFGNQSAPVFSQAENREFPYFLQVIIGHISFQQQIPFVVLPSFYKQLFVFLFASVPEMIGKVPCQ
ncbi:hypothetical protein DSECCO2_351960 [anaerobic digester metagenome]